MNFQVWNCLCRPIHENCLMSPSRPPKGGASAAALINLAKGRLPDLETVFLPTTSAIPRFPSPYPCVSLGHRVALKTNIEKEHWRVSNEGLLSESTTSRQLLSDSNYESSARNKQNLSEPCMSNNRLDE